MMKLTPWRLALRGLRGHGRSHAAVAAGVAVATLVLVGALVVGESVRGSLRGLVEQRLGRIESVVAPGRLFREALADESGAAPLLMAPASLSHRADGVTRRASAVTLIGSDERFAEFSTTPIELDGVCLTEAVAAELGVGAGDEIVVRTTAVTPLPSDSPLGEKADTVATIRLEVTRVLPPEGLARFSLRPSQGEPRSLFVPLETAQQLLNVEGEVSTLVAAGELPVEPTLEDYGLTIDEVRPGVWQLESRELVLPEAIVDASRQAWDDTPQAAAVTYLANTIRLGEKKIPYSTVVGAGGASALLPTGELADDEIVLSRWAADDLGAKVGDEITLTHYEPESTHGVLREATPTVFRLTGIVESNGEGDQPTVANDRRWTPELEGVTDAESINDWDLPFELVETIRPQDEDYWDEYNTTPKAFVSLATATRLWGSRWGDISLIRLAAEGATAEALGERLLAAIDPADLGFAPRAVRAESLRASSGSTPFDVLFLLFSQFLIGSALLLIVLLVWLAIDARRRELGLLGAVGFDRRAVRRGLLRELAPVAGVGAIVGAAAGVAYAAGLLALLRTVWVAAIGAPFLELHAGPASVVGGAIAAWLVATATIAWAVRSATKTPPRALLAGTTSSQRPAGTGWRRRLYPLGALAVGVMLQSTGSLKQGEAAAGLFFGSGMMFLTALIAIIYNACVRRRNRNSSLSLRSLAALNATRRPGRSLLTIGLVGAAAFLLLATGAFRLPPTDQGTGGFDLVGQTDQALHYDLATEEGRFELGFTAKEEAALADATVYSFRVQPGEDASCQNLYQATQPRVLGVPERFVAAADKSDSPFVFAPGPEPINATWMTLKPAERSADEPIPVVIDFNTAMYSLKLYGGVGSEFTILDEVGAEVTVRVAGLLKNSLLQGDLLMSEADFLRLYPSAAGYRFFLIDTPDAAATTAAVEEALGDYGFDAADAPDRLAGFLAVQNTYLSTFQALGGLGLALGAIGLAVAQLRNLNERRAELAVLRAGGFTRERLQRLVLGENLALLACGLVVGALAAAATLTPLALRGDTRPPWLMGLLLVGGVVALGAVAGRLAAARALAAPPAAALRGD